uniref:Seven TM Receptor n=1 Tax=Caenorhabditis tropicalis TaxID=1561998 RepID=A0A1I7V2P4_9PELO
MFDYLNLLSEKLGRVALFLSIFLGLILIPLTLFGIRKIFGTYKYLMVAFTSLGVVLAATETLFHVNLHLYNNGMIYFTLTPILENLEVMAVILSVYAGLYATTISLLAVQFLYRYWALFTLRLLKYFKNWKLIIWVFYCSFFGGLLSSCVFFLLKKDSVSEEYFQGEMMLRYNVSITEIPVLIILPFDSNGKVRWVDLMYIVMLSCIMGSQYLVMTYCGWMMHSRMELKLEHFSAALKHHHRQLFRTLVLQITTPTIFLFTPLIIVSYLPLAQLEISFPVRWVFCAISFYPVMDSIIVLVVVSEYRFAVQTFQNSSR